MRIDQVDVRIDDIRWCADLLPIANELPIHDAGQMTNLGAHEIDIIQWVMNVKGPNTISSSGGRYAIKDIGETPDTQDALLEYPGFTHLYSIREASAGRRAGAAVRRSGVPGR